MEATTEDKSVANLNQREERLAAHKAKLAEIAEAHPNVWKAFEKLAAAILKVEAKNRLRVAWVLKRQLSIVARPDQREKKLERLAKLNAQVALLEADLNQ